MTKSFYGISRLFGYAMSAGLVLLLCGASTANAQEAISILFRFNPSDPGYNSGNPGQITLTPGQAGAVYTIDVFAHITGAGGNTDPSQFGLQITHFLGFSSITAGGSAGAFGTGATLGYAGSFVGFGDFSGSKTTAP